MGVIELFWLLGLDDSRGESGNGPELSGRPLERCVWGSDIILTASRQPG